MTTSIAPPRQDHEQRQHEQRFVLRNVSWPAYEALLDLLGDRPVRMTYDRGSLELMSPSAVHEHVKRLIGRMIEMLTYELNIPLRSGGSTTFRRKDLDRGLEPDECCWLAPRRQARPAAA